MLLERLFELVLVAHVQHGLEVVGRVAPRADRDRVRVHRAPATDPEQRQRRRLADAGHGAVERERLRTLCLRGPCRLDIANPRDDRDPVTLRDALAQTS